MSGDAPFLEQIALDPADDTARLIYADWLEEQGDIRGEFIRVQCALAAGEGSQLQQQAWKQREESLLRHRAQQWLGPLNRKEIQVAFRGGLVAEMRIGAADFIRIARHLAARAPVLQKLRLFRTRGSKSEISEAVSLLASHAGFPSLRELDLSSCDLGGGQLARLVQAPYLARLNSLNLAWNLGIGDLGVDWLSHSWGLAELEVLDLRGITLSKRAVRMLAETERLQRMRLLVISQQPQRRSYNSSERFLRETLGHRLMVCSP